MTTVGDVMNLQIRMKLVVLAMFLILAEVFLTARASRAADDCVSKPNATPPQGTHWYYRVDRTTHRQCWYLGAEEAKVRPHQQQRTSTLRSLTSSNVAARPEPRTTIIAAAAPVTTTVIEVPAKTSSTLETSFVYTSGLGKPDGTLVDGSLISAKPADEYSATKISGNTLMARPIVSPTEVTTAEQPTGFAITFVHLLAALAVVLALVAIIGRTILRLRRICQPDETKLRGLGSKSSRLDKGRAPKFSNAAASTRHADVGRAMKPAMPRSSAAVAEIERSVRRLLHELHRRQHRLQGHDFERM
jgi:hypothetical protein